MTPWWSTRINSMQTKFLNRCWLWSNERNEGISGSSSLQAHSLPCQGSFSRYLSYAGARKNHRERECPVRKTVCRCDQSRLDLRPSVRRRVLARRAGDDGRLGCVRETWSGPDPETLRGDPCLSWRL